MFDIGFWELVMIGVVALLVIGPERLPGVARAAGLWVGKARRFVASVRADMEQELRADELKRVMQEQAKASGVHEIIEETRSVSRELAQAGNLPEGTPSPTPAAPVSSMLTVDAPDKAATASPLSGVESGVPSEPKDRASPVSSDNKAAPSHHG